MNIDTRIENLEHTIFGNGQPGLKIDVAVLKREMSEQRQLQQEIKKSVYRMERAFWAVLGVIAFVKFYSEIMH